MFLQIDLKLKLKEILVLLKIIVPFIVIVGVDFIQHIFRDLILLCNKAYD